MRLLQPAQNHVRLAQNQNQSQIVGDGPALTAISLTGILMAGLSGSWAYHRLGLIDYRSALAFAVPGDLGAILGVRIVHQISPSVFRIILGIMLMMLGASLLRHASHNVYTRRRRGVSHRCIRIPSHHNNAFATPVGRGYLGVL